MTSNASTAAPNASVPTSTASTPTDRDVTTPAVAPMPMADVAAAADRVLAAVGTAVVGMTEPLTLALAAVLAGGHVLFEDVPGLGKTLAARSMAAALGLDFRRVQCTPDLLPADLTGANIFDPATSTFTFSEGPVFTGLLLADEINRTPPKTQSALLEAMAERQVSVDGVTRQLAAPFHVMATSNPVEYEGTYPLPEAQLDRFLVRLSVGYLPAEQELDVLLRRVQRGKEIVDVPQVVDAATVLAMQAGVEALTVDRDIARYCVDLAAATRRSEAVEVGASPRGSQALVLLARAVAAIDGRDYVRPEDVKRVAVPALAHRITLNASAWAQGLATEEVVRRIVATVPGPTVTRE